ncbi:MAG: ATP-binding cassette domain-containing protein [Candidatus Hodarchaeales archaeon]|jgi:ABC-type lipoprotein export system ATPase subunit
MNSVRELIAKGNYDNALSLLQSNPDSYNQFDQYLLTSQIFEKKGYFEESEAHSRYAISNAPDQQSKVIANIQHASICLTFQRGKAFSKALDTSRREFLILPLDQRRIIKFWESNLLRLIGQASYNKYKELSALDYFFEAESILKSIESNEAKENYIETLTEIGNIYEKQGELIKAIDFYNRSYKDSLELENDKLTANILASKGRVFRKQERYEKAINVFEAALTLIDGLENKFSFLTLLDDLILCYHKLKDYSAATELKRKSIQLQDSFDRPEILKIPDSPIVTLKDPTGKENALIELRNVSSSYEESGSYYRTLNNINLSIFPGEFVVLRGPSGSCKSTLLRTCAGLSPVDTGEIFINGKLLSSLEEKERLNFLKRRKFAYIQDDVLIGDGKRVNLFESRSTLLDTSSLTSPILRTKVNELINRDKEEIENIIRNDIKLAFQIAEIENQYRQKASSYGIPAWYIHHVTDAIMQDHVGEGGKQRYSDFLKASSHKAISSFLEKDKILRLLIARIILSQPSVIFADEPTVMIASETSKAILEVLDLYRKTTNAALVLITHRGSLTEKATRQVFLRKGRITSIMEMLPKKP